MTKTMMKVAVYYNNRDVRLEERPIPQIGPGELLVKAEACGLCGGDTMEWYLLHKAPIILGHEPTGTVVEVGRESGWYVGDEMPYFHFRGPELAGKTLGLVGCGAIGQALARRACALGMNVLGNDPYMCQDDLGSIVHLAPWNEILARADFLSLHVPLSEETRGMIGAAELARMKPTAVLVNTARAAVVDEEALYKALLERRIAGAALDVFWQEPLPPDSPWLELDNVLLTPHLAGAADDVRKHHSAMVVEDVRTLLSGESPKRLVNPQVFQASRSRRLPGSPRT